MTSSTHLLADTLFTKGQQRVLGLLFGHPDRSFFANEIIRHAGGGAGAIHRELEALTKAGVLSENRIGNQRHFQANPACPIFDELHRIIRKTFGIAGVLHEALQPFTQKIALAFVYGSVARGEETANSDIDLFIISQTLAYPDIFPALAETEKQLARTVNPTIYKQGELERKQDEGNAFANRMLVQPKIFIIGNENDLPKPAQPG
jgi:predicted nucleotidyltransferase